MSDTTEVTRVALASAVPLLQMGVIAALSSRGDFLLAGVAEAVDEMHETLTRTQPDVMVIDADMPGGDVLTTARALRRSYPALGVVLLGRDSDDLLFKALDAGLSAFVPTSAPTQTLLAATRHAAATPSSFSAPGLASALARRDRQRTRLSPRELEVLRLLRDGFTLHRIANEIGVSESTAKTYVARLYDKLGVHSRAQAVAVAGSSG